MALLNHILAPYPKAESRRDRVIFAIGTGVFVALFLVLFQPFGTREYQSASKYLFLAGYGAVVALGMGLFTILLPVFFPRVFREETWTVGKHILFIWLAVCFCIFLCYAYKQWYFDLPLKVSDLGYFGLISASVAIFPITALVVMDYIRKLKHYQQGTGRVEPAREEVQTTIELSDEYGKVAFAAPVRAILYIQAADNYAEIYHRRKGDLERQLIRHSLKAIAAQLAETPLTRCHRSYLVNLDHVERISGNAQGYRFHLKDCELSVPVARSRSELVEQFRQVH